MTESLPALTEPAGAAAPHVPAVRRGAFRRLVRNPLGLVAAVVLLVVVVGAAAAPWLTTHAPDAADLRSAFGPSAPGHPLGLDSAGRDIWSRLLFGARNTLGGALLALAVAMVLGIPAGLVAGYAGRWFDAVSGWVVNLLMALPAMIVLLAARAIIGPTVWALMIILGVLAAPSFFRLVRGIVVNVRHELYVDSARVSGLPPWRIIGRHVLVVVRAPIIIQISLVAGVALGLQAGLEFIGVGSSSDLPTWGGMLNEGFQFVQRDRTLLLWPGLALGLTSAALVLLGAALRDVLEDRGTDPVVRRRDRAAQRAVAPAVLDGKAERSPLLSIRSLAVSYALPDGSQREVVHEVDLDVRPGEVVGLVGESGSGKTQTAFSALGILPSGGRVSRGSIQVDGQEVVGLSAASWRQLRSHVVSYVPQEPMSNLDPSFTVGSQLVEPIRAATGASRAQARERALGLLRSVEIEDPERTFRAYPHEISGGMAQRVLLAGAMACNPRLLIADEPTTALDVTVQAEVLEVLRRLQQERGLGVLLVTHSLGVVADLCDTVAVMQDGRIVESGPVDQVLTAPREEYTRRLLAAVLDEGQPPTVAAGRADEGER
ncbi:ABC-type dipeptide/oligopeptide/nickel transport system, ATPase component [Blastococcus aurantiacus]|uniref:ABC-type dipeptide/oligopeptide/nickel transport system, ATPase component n=1 Tax=Blastococcus aurantiacus TaxID=1550231 RepID=A0A1G7NRR8_9ACTN|nr:dipeptide/oligopeptide/nickel ABC transporter permease/ATP-binding protein [Blastococcus aurantiacus]SDF76676.1 ABC-type dipeptide/oligopeptide/nickel transport system, ATPase component [Blastococcus aurantiacus]